MRKQVSRIFSKLSGVFQHQGKTHIPLVSLFLLLNAVVLFNSIFHDPYIGYDTSAYLEYIDTLADGRLPGSEDSGEYYSPPLAFVPPAIAYSALRPFSSAEVFNPPYYDDWLPNFLYFRFLLSIDDFALGLSAKFAQLVNVVYSLVLTFFLLKICGLIRPGSIRLKIMALFLLMMLPVYFKTFAFVRPDPLFATIVVFAFYYLLSLYRQENITVRNVLILGLVAGLGMLTRQWFAAALFTIFVSIGLIAYMQGMAWKRILGLVTIFFLVTLVVAMPFYLHLNSSEGSPIAYGRALSLASLSSEWSNYFGLDLDKLFRDPLRSSFGLNMLPILYSDTWGDYWGYFVFYAREKRAGRYIEGQYADSKIITPEEIASGEKRFETNRFTINAYLGRVNAVAIVPGSLFLAGFVMGLSSLWKLMQSKLRKQDNTYTAILSFFILVSVFIYFIFLLIYTQDTPDTIKTTYIIHIFPFIALLGADAMLKLERANKSAYKGILIALVLVFLHNIPALLTRHIL